MLEHRVSGIGVLDKSVSLVDAVAAADGRCSLAELVAATGLPKPTAHRLAVALEAHGWLRRDATALGPAGTMGPVDLVFLDPPYGMGLGEKALASLRAGGWLKPDTLLVLEDGSDVTVNLPDGFTLEDRREYGAAAVHLISLA